MKHLNIFLYLFIGLNISTKSQDLNIDNFLKNRNYYKYFTGDFSSTKAMETLFGNYSYKNIEEKDGYYSSMNTNFLNQNGTFLYYTIKDTSFILNNNKFHYLIYGSNTDDRIKESCGACFDWIGISLFITNENINYLYYSNDTISNFGRYNNSDISFIEMGYQNIGIKIENGFMLQGLLGHSIDYLGFFQNCFFKVISVESEEGFFNPDTNYYCKRSVELLKSKQTWFNFKIKSEGTIKKSDSLIQRKIKNDYGEIEEYYGYEVMPSNNTKIYCFMNGKYSSICDGKVNNSINNRNSTEELVNKISDVDIDIPINNENPNKNIFALVIGNEDYRTYQPSLSSEANVPFAENDAKMFKEYLNKTLGVSNDNITLLINAKAIDINRALDKLCSFAKPLDGNVELFFYYAGHGLPDETLKESYLYLLIFQEMN